MKSFVCCLVAFAAVAQAQFNFPYPGMMGPAVSSTQYHTQDKFGQVRFGYSYPGQAASNMRDAFGNMVGSYAYINPEGKEVMVSYTADHRGFRVLSNDLPVAPVANLVAPVANLVAPLPVQDTPEVAQAKAIHMAALAAAKMAKSKVPLDPVPVAPAPVVPAQVAVADSVPVAPVPVPVNPIDHMAIEVMDTLEVAAVKRLRI